MSDRVHGGWRHLPECYGCGPGNPAGLGLDLTGDGDTATGRVTFGDRFVGGPGLVHGGALVTVLDEVMGAVPGPDRRARVTKEMTVRFRRPVALGRAVVATADVVDRDDHGYRVVARLRYDGDAAVRAEAEAAFVLVDRPPGRRG